MQNPTRRVSTDSPVSPTKLGGGPMCLSFYGIPVYQFSAEINHLNDQWSRKCSQRRIGYDVTCPNNPDNPMCRSSAVCVLLTSLIDYNLGIGSLARFVRH